MKRHTNRHRPTANKRAKAHRRAKAYRKMANCGKALLWSAQRNGEIDSRKKMRAGDLFGGLDALPRLESGLRSFLETLNRNRWWERKRV